MRFAEARKAAKTNAHPPSKALPGMLTRLPLIVLLTLTGFGLAQARAEVGVAAMTSGWSKGSNANMRLIVGGVDQSADGMLLAGLELRLDRGWKTYWRSPGDSGVPPVFDWSRSKNLGSIRVLWPAPKRFVEAGGASNGYVGDTVFPIEIRPARANKPIELRLNAEFGICREICVPSEAELELTIPADPVAAGPFDTVLARALDRVPATGQGDHQLAIETVELTGADTSPRLVIQVRYPEAAGDVELFVEAGDAYLAAPRVSAPPRNGRARFTVAIDAAQLQDLKERPLTLTLVSGATSREVSWRLE